MLRVNSAKDLLNPSRSFGPLRFLGMTSRLLTILTLAPIDEILDDANSLAHCCIFNIEEYP